MLIYHWCMNQRGRLHSFLNAAHFTNPEYNLKNICLTYSNCTDTDNSCFTNPTQYSVSCDFECEDAVHRCCRLCRRFVRRWQNYGLKSFCTDAHHHWASPTVTMGTCPVFSCTSWLILWLWDYSFLQNMWKQNQLFVVCEKKGLFNCSVLFHLVYIERDCIVTLRTVSVMHCLLQVTM